MAYTDLSSYVPASYFFPGKINQEGWQLSFQALKKKPGRAWSHAVWLQISSASPSNNELMSRVFPHWRAAHQMGWVSPTDLIFFPSSRHGAAGSGKTQSLFLPVWSTSSEAWDKLVLVCGHSRTWLFRTASANLLCPVSLTVALVKCTKPSLENKEETAQLFST